MRFGVNLPSYWSSYGTSSMHEAIEETAKAAAALGYASVWTNDHILVPANRGRSGVQIEPLITLSSLIHLVPSLDLGTSVLVLPQRDAILVAKQAAALDVLSQGRCILGLGVGWNKQEFSFHHADFEHRGAITDEAIQVMRALWQEPQVSFHGQFYEFTDALFFPKPLRQKLPLWIGGQSAAAIRRAARYGQAWVPFGADLNAFKRGKAALEAQPDGHTLPMLALHLSLRILNSAGSPSQDKPTNVHLVGTPEEITAALDAYYQSGLEYLICLFEADELSDLLHQMQLFAETVAPHLSKKG